MERTADNQVTVLAASTYTENMGAQHKKEKERKKGENPLTASSPCCRQLTTQTPSENRCGDNMVRPPAGC